MSQRSPKRIEEAVIKDLLSGQDTPLLKRILKQNQIIKHNYKKEIKRILTCELPGCEKTFLITIFPNQLIYPKYCEAHRCEYQRSRWQNQ